MEFASAFTKVSQGRRIAHASVRLQCSVKWVTVWELRKRCLGVAWDFRKSGFNLLVVQHLKWLFHRFSNVDCCSQFGSGEIGLTKPTCRTIFRRCQKFLLSECSAHECVFLSTRAQLPELACEWTLVWARVEHFCYKLDRVKAFMHIATEGLQHGH